MLKLLLLHVFLNTSLVGDESAPGTSEPNCLTHDWFHDWEKKMEFGKCCPYKKKKKLTT